MKQTTTNARRAACLRVAPGYPKRVRRPRLFFALAAAAALLVSPLVLSQTKGDPPLIVLDPSGVPAVLDSLDRNYEAIIEVPEILVEELPDPGSVVPRAANKVWLIPDVESSSFRNDNGDLRRSTATPVFVINAGDTVAEVSCVYFDNDGVLNLDQGSSKSVSPAARDSCSPLSRPFRGWGLVLSDRPVLVSGWYVETWYEGFLQVKDSKSRDVPIYPIDCDYPEGIEFACQFVAP